MLKPIEGLARVAYEAARYTDEDYPEDEDFFSHEIRNHADPVMWEQIATAVERRVARALFAHLRWELIHTPPLPGAYQNDIVMRWLDDAEDNLPSDLAYGPDEQGQVVGS